MQRGTLSVFINRHCAITILSLQPAWRTYRKWSATKISDQTSAWVFEVPYAITEPIATQASSCPSAHKAAFVYYLYVLWARVSKAHIFSEGVHVVCAFSHFPRDGKWCHYNLYISISKAPLTQHYVYHEVPTGTEKVLTWWRCFAVPHKEKCMFYFYLL